MSKGLVLIGWMLCCAACLAQQYPFVYYTPREGLVNSRVRGIKQDSKGRMLFITYDGLSIYDGVNFKNYRQQEGLANELVNDILEITPDSFLIASNTSQLNTLVRGKIGQFKTSDNFYPVINRFLKSDDGYLYVAADDGLFKMADNKFVRIPLLNTKGEDIGQNLDRITEWNNYFFIIPWNLRQKEKLIIYGKEKQTVVATITDKRILSIAVSPQDEIWVSSSTGIARLDLAAFQKGKIKLNPQMIADFGKEWHNPHIYFDPRGDAWIFDNAEVIKFTPDGKKQFISPLQGLKQGNLADIFVDREGITWMGSDGNGVIKIPGTNVQILSDLVPGIKNHILALHHESDTNWVYNRTDNTIYRIHHDILTAFHLRLDSTYVLKMYTGGESLYFVANNKLYQVRNKNLPASYLDPVTIFPDTSNVLELGVGLVDPNGMIIQYVQQDEKTFYLAVIQDQKVLMKSPLSFMVDQLALDKEGRLWVPTRNNHLFVYALHPESPSQYLQLLHDYSREIEGISPRSIAIDNIGNAWIGTRYDGIYQFHFEGSRLINSCQFTMAQGLTDNFVNYLHYEPNDEIWAGSLTGLDKIFLKDDQYIIENITKSKGIFQGIYKITNANNHDVWAITSNGNILSISGDKLTPNPVPPPLLISYFAVNNEEYNINTTVFPHHQNNLSISVAAASFLDERSIQYSYLLDGASKTKWSDPSNNAHFNFINLAHGNYTVYFKAEFPASVYPAQMQRYAFTIRPPFWKTWWFLSLAGISMLGSIGVGLGYYYRQKLEKQRTILEKKQAIEKERTRIATDMHDDLGAGLSRIKFLSETIGIKKQKHLPVDEEIHNIRHYAHDMIDKMGEIVWALNEKNDSLSDLLSYTRAYAVEYLAENGLQSKIAKLPPHGNVMVNGEFRRNIYLSVKETLHNVIKHARANRVTIQFETTDKLAISIQDDGVGFDPENTRPFANGLTNIRRRMSEIQGELQIINDHGTRIILKAPLPS